MLRLSQFPFKTLKTLPKVSDNRSTSLLLQGGYIRQAMAGAYEFLPMGWRVLERVEKIIHEELDAAGCHQMLMTILTPKEMWETTGRWDIPEYFRVPAHGNSEYRIAPTNEENVSRLFAEFIQSYKDLPTCVYHTQKKFRNEKRAKSGLLRGREFVMNDAYSFHANIEDFDEFYEKMKSVYLRIYDRLGLGKDTVIADADGGAISDKNSHEFQVFLPIGEDIIVTDSSGYAYNLELASGVADEKNTTEAVQKIEYIDSIPEIVNMEQMAKYFQKPLWQMLKTVLYRYNSGEFFAVIIRGDLEINEIKLRNFLKKHGKIGFSLATEEDLVTLGTIRGFVTPLKEKNPRYEVFADESIKSVKNFYAGANEIAKSTKNVNISDLHITEFADFNEPVEGFTSINVPGEKLQFRRASEVGNIFHLGDKYSKPFGITFTDENNEKNDRVEMGCYGIGVSRLVGVMAEYFMSEKGIHWPESVAPYDIFILVLGEENLAFAEEIAKKYESEGKSVILDDRMGSKWNFGQKAGDCELWGIPTRISITPKTRQK